MISVTRKHVVLLVGTQRGVFLLQSDRERREWSLKATGADPGWSYGHVQANVGAGMIYAAGHSAWYGPAVWRSADLGRTWSLSGEGISFGVQGPSVRRVWQVASIGGALYAGVDPAGLFRSDDGGTTWFEVGASLRTLPAFARYVPGKGGLPVHSILGHQGDPQQLWIAIAGGGVLHTADGGVSWAPRNACTGDGQEALRVQKLVAVPGAPELLVQQNHQGVFRSPDGGRSWHNVTDGLPTPFGFPMAVLPGPPSSLFAIPHHNEGGMRYVEGGRLAVWRSRDGGETWSRRSQGLPEHSAFTSVLRDGMAVDQLDPPGIYFGTTSGSLCGSTDGGDSWRTIAERLPEILSVEAAIIETN